MAQGGVAERSEQLTRRQLEVAAWVAKGLSNRQIAEALFLSERTVESHVQEILWKLGLQNRTQVATWFTKAASPASIAPVPATATATSPYVRRDRRVRGRHLAAMAAVTLLVLVTATAYLRSQPAPATISTVAVTTTDTTVYSMAVAPDGALYFPDGNALRKVMPGGAVTTVGGAGTLLDPTSVAVAPGGTAYVAERDGYRVRAYRNGTWTQVCGNGSTSAALYATFIPDATAVACDAEALAFGPDRRLYITLAFRPPYASSMTYQGEAVVALDAAGSLSLVAGRGIGYSGDGGPAVDATFAGAAGLAVDRAGNLYIADSNNDRVRRVDRHGVITTVAGDGVTGDSGDGGPATHAELNRPIAVAVDSSGDLYISELGGDRIRRVDARGIITTVAGTGRTGFGGDGGPAIRATLAAPAALAVDDRGDLFVDDVLNRRIRQIHLDRR